MPTYTYRCNTCQTLTEMVQSMTDPPMTQCITCQDKVHRIITPGIGIQFKGSGFYCTDSNASS